MSRIDRTHGSGGVSTSGLIRDIFQKELSNVYLDSMCDSAIVPGSSRLAVTTDSFVIRPLFYAGGDIGSLAVCGTVNDLLVAGASPEYLTAGFILEEGLDTEILRQAVHSMAESAKESGVSIVAGDTKVIEPSDPSDPGLIINTAGVGFVDKDFVLSPSKISDGDSVIVSGSLGDHHAAILSSRLSIKNNIISDTAPLCDMISNLKNEGIELHAMRDVTRGGLATILNELSDASGCRMLLEETSIPVSPEVSSFCRILGLDPLYMGNEGKCVFILARPDAERALSIIQKSRYGECAAIIGNVSSTGKGVVIRTAIGGEKIVGPLYGEGLPRIC